MLARDLTNATLYYFDGAVEDAPTGGATSSLGYGGFLTAHNAVETGMPYVEVPNTLWGDYCGSDVGRSNARSLVRDYPDTFVTVAGYPGAEFLALPADYGKHSHAEWTECSHNRPSCCDACHTEDDTNAVESAQELLIMLEGLAVDYPLYDDEDHSNLEAEVAEESWDSYVRFEITRTLEHDHGLEVDSVEDETLRTLWNESLWATAEATDGQAYYLESAVSVVFPHYDETVALMARLIAERK